MLGSWFGRGAPGDVTAAARTPAAQVAVDRETARLTLYHYESCWFCARVRRAIEELKLTIEKRDIIEEPAHAAALMEGGGSTTVPCLRIEQEDGTIDWMYESAVIIDYLKQRFGALSRA